MKKKRWKAVIIMITLVFTHALAFRLYPYVNQTVPYISFVDQKQDGFRMNKKDGQILGGVLIPDNLLYDDEEKNWNFAKNFMSEKNKWIRLKSGNLPGIKKSRGFIFEMLADNEMILSYFKTKDR